MRQFWVAAVVLMLLSGCGRANSPASPPSAAAKPDIVVTVDGEHHTCVVAKYAEPTGSTIGCADVVSFVKDELRVRAGSSYELHGPAATDRVEADKTKAALDAAGFKFVGGLE
jgi:hypothetical protein